MDLWQDVRYALRRLVDARWFTTAAIAALAIGIGANAMGFTIVNAVMLRPLPFEDSDAIVVLESNLESGGQAGVSFPDIEDILDQSRTLTHVVGIVNSSINLSDEERDPERIQGAYVSEGFFDMLRVTPVLGRTFADEDDRPGAAPVIVIGDAVWQNRYGGDQNVLGRTVRVNSLVATIVGVMPPGMQFVENVDLWIPKDNLPPESQVENRDNRGRNVLGRLAPGATLDQASEELALIGQRLADAYPETNTGVRPYVVDFEEWYNGGEISMLFSMVMGAVIFVLLIACANVANLMLAKSADRAKEIAVRVSLGATRWRIVRQLLVESLIIALVAGGVGLLIGLAGIRWFDSVTQDVGKPYWMEFTLDPVVFVYVAAVCLFTAVAFGLAPALQVSKTDVNEVLQEGTRGGSGGHRARRMASAFVIGEVVLTVVLLSGAAFFSRSFQNLYAMNDDIDTEDMLVMQIYLPLTKYPQAPEQLAVLTELVDRLEEVPGIEAAALTTSPPMLGGGGGASVELDGRPQERDETSPRATLLTVSDRYLATLRMEPTQGRDFNRADGEPGNETVIVNERFVEMYLSDGNALGRLVRIGLPFAAPDEGWATVIGVVPNVRQAAVEAQETDPVVYVPFRGRPSRTTALMVRAQGDPGVVTSEIRRTMRAVEPDVPVYDVRTMEEALAENRLMFAIFGIMFSAFAGAALLLSSVGLYSITARSVIQRTREFGIRLSLGAQPREIRRLALRRVLIQLAIGLPIGLAGAYGVGNLLEGIMVRVTAGDPLILGGIAVLLSAIAVVACLVPARRAGAVDPVTALRVE